MKKSNEYENKNNDGMPVSNATVDRWDESWAFTYCAAARRIKLCSFITCFIREFMYNNNNNFIIFFLLFRKFQQRSCIVFVVHLMSQIPNVAFTTRLGGCVSHCVNVCLILDGLLLLFLSLATSFMLSLC